MTIRKRLAIVASVAVLFQPSGWAQTKARTIPREQLTFGSDIQTIDHPATVPPVVLQIIRKVSGAAPNELPAKWLLASEIHLDGPNELDLIVVGTDKLGGPHTVPFWVFRKTPAGHRLVLANGGDSLQVLNIRWKGFREIQIDNSSLTTRTTATYRFDGQQYRLFRKKTTSVR